ncbi:MAG: c-type cytochrome [Rhodocyclaceae bacterium]|nr:c-type cytochrome [Rhodocyclaceae bacterium]
MTSNRHAMVGRRWPVRFLHWPLQSIGELVVRNSKVFSLFSVLGALGILLGSPIRSEAADSSRSINPALLYHNYCSVCHGDRGDGNSRAKNSLIPPPRDFTAGPLPVEYMRKIVADGKPGTAMVGWKTQLNEKEIAAVVDYVAGTFMSGKAFSVDPDGLSGISAHGGREKDAPAPKPAAPAPKPAPTSGVDMAAPMPAGLTGDPVKGGKFFMGNCATCHGEKGDGNGPRAYFINPVPRDFTLEGSRMVYNRPALFKAISKGSLGSEMPAWDKVLTPQQIADVAEFVFQQFIQHGPETASAK